MSERVGQYRSKPSQELLPLLHAVGDLRMYVISRSGPTSFVLREEVDQASAELGWEEGVSGVHRVGGEAVRNDSDRSEAIVGENNVFPNGYSGSHRLGSDLPLSNYSPDIPSISSTPSSLSLSPRQSSQPSQAPPNHASPKQFKVMIGSRNLCSCTAPAANGTCRELCPHLVFVLGRVLRIPPTNPLCWQLSYTDRELEEVLKYGTPVGSSNRSPLPSHLNGGNGHFNTTMMTNPHNLGGGGGGGGGSSHGSDSPQEPGSSSSTSSASSASSRSSRSRNPGRTGPG
eukprot:CAMPEP_0175063046 /NCGR_PEP_ID=MMETSP0052_2-20121109/14521_1 /TAXON_ID=51329 ORGANISM="Polytomella parva, Strain SAG 63-3" /NCGR_SAMPLE_ID=MMETSP0052_2 /ASSEMBLY_ACC=CAM_ASM_000194 /LENGTH=285 /DNA_ID=CAMNT_0016329165 /DNA_START=38 /DNA_END=891 /DNA_ORIENTATION=+